MWFPGETVSVSIGQGPLLVTPLQMAVMMATVANGGHVVRPHLWRGRRAAASRVRPASSTATLDFIKDALAAVVNEGGTGGRARLATMRVAGKTGTAQVIRQETHIDSAQLDVRASRSRLVRLVRAGRGPAAGGGRLRRARRPRARDAAAPLAKLLYERYLEPPPVPRDT